MINLEFRIINKEISSIVDEKTLYITGIANSGCEDLVGDTVTQQALEQICADAPNHNLHLDHDTMFDGIVGTITEANLVDEGVEIKARILNERREEIESLLNQGVKLGLSIAGVTKCNDDNPSLIDEWILTEISLTPVPCDQQTMGTVQIAKSFKQLINRAGKMKKEEDTIESSNETEENNTTTSGEISQDGGNNMAEENTMTEDAVIELINTAFGEKQEELLEAIRKELKEEYEAKFNAQEERISAIEAQIEALKQPAESTEPAEPPVTEEEVEEEETTESAEDTEEDIEKALTKVLAKMFGVKVEPAEPQASEPTFRYSDKKGKPETKKGYTPRELAEMMANQ